VAAIALLCNAIFLFAAHNRKISSNLLLCLLAMAALGRAAMVETSPESPPAPDEPKPAKSLGPLRMIWREMLRYPRQLALAFLALITTSTATLSIPWGIKGVVDRAAADRADTAMIGQAFELLMVIVAVLGIATAVRFYHV